MSEMAPTRHGYFCRTIPFIPVGPLSLYRTLSSTHRGLTVLEDVPLLAVVRAAESAALVELDEHRVGGVAGAVDVDAILVVRVAWQGK